MFLDRSKPFMRQTHPVLSIGSGILLLPCVFLTMAGIPRVLVPKSWITVSVYTIPLTFNMCGATRVAAR